MSIRHFLTLFDLSSDELSGLIDRAQTIKNTHEASDLGSLMSGMTMVMLFEKPSTRTRITFEVAATHFGGHTVFLEPQHSQLSRGESLSDTSRVISSMADLIVMRTFAHDRIVTLAEFSSVPVINAMSDSYHPCQLLADVLTFTEKKGSIRDAKISWVGDGNNVCHSWINAAVKFNFDLQLACPPRYEPDPNILEVAKNRVKLMHSPKEAVARSDLVVTDTWRSIGSKMDNAQIKQDFYGFTVTNSLMELAHEDALFMHCLPAYRGEEVSAEVIDGPQSVVWEETENRLHAQKALMEFLIT